MLERDDAVSGRGGGRHQRRANGEGNCRQRIVEGACRNRDRQWVAADEREECVRPRDQLRKIDSQNGPNDERQDSNHAAFKEVDADDLPCARSPALQHRDFVALAVDHHRRGDADVVEHNAR